ncbi:T-complex protein 10 [Histomonas meleagridis]|uniref:T-complex protein 10 n=1 Tax=Histomonas meleagridis TaxID=135588 RepID=UPI00355A5137|nr:T-complex protein 10 [Histomonas meleagridis]KAH0804290.1 T-complex protein 10 [Histomonas meleagridis]
MKKETEKQVNVIENSNKVCANCQHLKDEYEQEKAQWAIEKKELLLRIQALQSFLSSDLESKKVTKTYDENAKSSKKHYKTKYEVHQLKKEKNPKSQKKIPRKSPIKYQITPIVDNIPNVYNHTKKQKIIFPIEKQHLDFKLKLNQPTTEEIKPNGQIVRKYRNGTTEIQYKDGTRKVWCGNVNYIFYTNGDIEKEFEDGVKSYKFKETGTVEISNLNNSTIYVFSNGQKEMHDMNGEISIQFPNGHTKIFNPLFDTDSSSEKSIE